APHIQGFTFNGELAAALPATGAVAAALAWRRSRTSIWIVVAGLAGGTVLLMKESGFDGLLVASAVVGSVSLRRWRNIGMLAAGAAVPLGASAIHGIFRRLERLLVRRRRLQADSPLGGGCQPREPARCARDELDPGTPRPRAAGASCPRRGRLRAAPPIADM